jgi:hypothetical protein
MAAEQSPTPESLLENANGRRRVRILRPNDIRSLIERASEKPDGWCDWVSGGTVCGSYSYAAVTTVAAVARIDGSLYLGVSTGSAHNRDGSPAIAWCEWRGLSQAKPGRRLEKLRAWADHHLGKTVVRAGDERTQ